MGNDQTLNSSLVLKKADSNEDAAQHFICIKEIRPVSRAKALRLKTGDVIVGIEGKTFLMVVLKNY